MAFLLLKRINVTLILVLFIALADDKPQKARTQAFAAVTEVTIAVTKTRTEQMKCPHDPIQLCHQFYEVKIAAYEKKRRGLRDSLPGVD